MTASAASWVLELKARLAAAWISKMLTTTLGITGFFVAYFWVMHNPQGATFIMPLTAIDRLVPLEPRAMPLYLSLWVYVSLGPALLRNGRELAGYGCAAFVIGAGGLLIFLLWPTSTPDFGIDWDRYPSMAFLKDVDASANACPSLHVAFAVFTGFRLDRLLGEIGLARRARFLNLLWCAGIVYSTLAVRQHVMLDAVAGAALGAAVALFVHPAVLRRQAPVIVRPVSLVMRSLGQPAARLLRAGWAQPRARALAPAPPGAAPTGHSIRAPDRQPGPAAADPVASGAAPSPRVHGAGRLRSG